MRHVLRHIGQAETGQRRIEHLRRAVKDELAIDSHLQLAATSFELSGVQPAMSLQAQIDATVVVQVLRLLWRGPLGEIRWSADDLHTRVRPDADCNHVLRHLLAGSHAGVVALSNDVGQALVDGDLDLDVRILRQEFREFRPEDRVGHIVDRRDPNRAGGLVPKLA